MRVRLHCARSRLALSPPTLLHPPSDLSTSPRANAPFLTLIAANIYSASGRLSVTSATHGAGRDISDTGESSTNLLPFSLWEHPWEDLCAVLGAPLQQLAGFSHTDMIAMGQPCALLDEGHMAAAQVTRVQRIHVDLLAEQKNGYKTQEQVQKD